MGKAKRSPETSFGRCRHYESFDLNLVSGRPAHPLYAACLEQDTSSLKVNLLPSVPVLPTYMNANIRQDICVNN